MQAHWPFPNDKIMVGYAYILTHPGIPSIFWDHLCDSKSGKDGKLLIHETGWQDEGKTFEVRTRRR